MSDSMIQSAARLAMYDALTILEAAKELDSNYDVGMHPNTKVEWQALIGSAQANVPAGCIQRHMLNPAKNGRPSLFVTHIYASAEDSGSSTLRHVSLFDWREQSHGEA